MEMQAITRKCPAESFVAPVPQLPIQLSNNALPALQQSAEFVAPKVIKTVRKRYVGDVLPESASRMLRKSMFEYGLIVFKSILKNTKIKHGFKPFFKLRSVFSMRLFLLIKMHKADMQ